MAQLNADEIRATAKRAGLTLTDDEAAQLAARKTVPVSQGKLQALGGCSGIKIVDLGHGCGLYLNPFPPSVNVCCET